MKTVTCKEIGGACDMKFTANTFDEIVQMSKTHGAEMFQKQDSEHLMAINKMKDLMQDPKKMQKWFEEKRLAFDSLSDD